MTRPSAHSVGAAEKQPTFGQWLEGQRRSAAAEQAAVGEPEVLWEGRYSLADMNLVWFGTILLTGLMVFLGIWYERVDPSQQVPWLHNPWILWPAALALPVLLWILVFTSKWALGLRSGGDVDFCRGGRAAYSSAPRFSSYPPCSTGPSFWQFLWYSGCGQFVWPSIERPSCGG